MQCKGDGAYGCPVVRRKKERGVPKPDGVQSDPQAQNACPTSLLERKATASPEEVWKNQVEVLSAFSNSPAPSYEERGDENSGVNSSSKNTPE